MHVPKPNDSDIGTDDLIQLIQHYVVESYIACHLALKDSIQTLRQARGGDSRLVDMESCIIGSGYCLTTSVTILHVVKSLYKPSNPTINRLVGMRRSA
jgi:hypothetical protein